MGQVKSNDSKYIAPYQYHLEGILNYPMYYTIHEVFAQHQSMTLISDHWERDDEMYHDTGALGLFLDNHDVNRFLNQTDSEVMLRNALTFIFTANGIPVMYYGTEQNLKGG